MDEPTIGSHGEQEKRAQPSLGAAAGRGRGRCGFLGIFGTADKGRINAADTAAGLASRPRRQSAPIQSVIGASLFKLTVSASLNPILVRPSVPLSLAVSQVSPNKTESSVRRPRRELRKDHATATATDRFEETQSQMMFK